MEAFAGSFLAWFAALPGQLLSIPFVHPWLCPALLCAGVVCVVVGALRLSAFHRRTGRQ